MSETYTKADVDAAVAAERAACAQRAQDGGDHIIADAIRVRGKAPDATEGPLFAGARKLTTGVLATTTLKAPAGGKCDHEWSWVREMVAIDEPPSLVRACLKCGAPDVVAPEASMSADRETTRCFVCGAENCQAGHSWQRAPVARDPIGGPTYDVLWAERDALRAEAANNLRVANENAYAAHQYMDERDAARVDVEVLRGALLEIERTGDDLDVAIARAALAEVSQP